MVNEIKRMNYYNGLFLKEEDFTTDQDYSIKMRRLMNWSLNKVFGVLEGLKVEPSEGKKYRVSSGIALSKGEDNWHGVEMVLSSDGEADFSKEGPGVYYLTIKYNEVKGDKDESKGDSEIHLIERPIIEIKSSTSSFDKEKEIVLVKVTVPEGDWKSDVKYLNLDDRKEIGPSLRCINNKAVIGTSDLPARLEVNGDIKAKNTELQNLSVQGNLSIGTINPVSAINIGSPMFRIEQGDGSPNLGYVRFGDGTGWKLHFGRSISGASAVTGTKDVLMTIQDNGNVGIGTTNPSAKLDVDGNIKAKDTELQNLSVQGNVGIGTMNIGSSMFRIEQSDGSPNMGYVRFGDGTGWKLHFGRSISGGSAITGTNDVLMTIQDNGNVGIGTTNPADKLNIDPQGNGGILIGNSNWVDGGYTSLMMGISKEKEGYAWIRSIKSSGKEPGDICFNPEYPSYGNVGIGTDKPHARLHVEATDKPTIMAHSEYGGLVSGSSGGNGVFGTNIYIDSNNKLKTAGKHDGNYGYAGMHATWGSINFYAAGGNTTEKGDINPLSRLFIRGSDGYVGIGTPSPQFGLDVKTSGIRLGVENNGGGQLIIKTRKSASIPEDNRKVIIYTDSYFRGNPLELGKGEYKDTDLIELGKKTRDYVDTASSLKVPPGMKVTLYDGASFDGDKREYVKDIDNLGDDGFNDRDGSIKVDIIESIIPKYENVISIQALDSDGSGAKLELVGPDSMKKIPYLGLDVSDVRIYGNLSVAGHKNFSINHPLHPDTHNLVHSTLEGPETAVFYRGEAQLSNGEAIVELPNYFEALTCKENRTVLLTPKFEDEPRVSMLAASDVKNGKFSVKMIDNKNPLQKFYWEVKAIRADVDILEVEQVKTPFNSCA